MEICTHIGQHIVFPMNSYNYQAK
uniref:Uncharacterized protein n=1 Tax=Arundo donax TaxID=35708 RepID=A0A0A8Y0R0_ARUDO